eukprot:1936748-Rhodomonas_salina.2
MRLIELVQTLSGGLGDHVADMLHATPGIDRREGLGAPRAELSLSSPPRPRCAHRQQIHAGPT